jgi:serine/threonine protein kinase
MSGSITLQDYVIQERLGQGAFGNVWMAHHIQTQLPVAVKVIPKSRTEAEDDRMRVHREVEFLRSLHHPNIVAFYEFLEDLSNFYIVMEIAEGGTLLEMISINRSISEPTAKKYLRQIASAVRYLHETNHIAHRDLKCENLMLDRHSNIRLIDFELSHSSESIMQTVCGTAAYTAPEMIAGTGYGPSVDIWSIGVILYAMVSGRLPFGDQTRDVILKEILYSDPLQDMQFSEGLVDLLSKIFQRNPANRISLENILKHPWLQGEDAAVMDPDIVHQKTVETLAQLGVPESAADAETPAYRIVYRSIEANCTAGSVPKPAPSFGARATVSTIGRQIIKPLVIDVRPAHLMGGRSTDIIKLKPAPTPPRPTKPFSVGLGKRSNTMT